VQRMYFGHRFSGSDKSLHSKVFVKAAEADGFGFAVRLSEKDRVRQTLEDFVAYPGRRSWKC